jgi:serine/threonine protein kinase
LLLLLLSLLSFVFNSSASAQLSIGLSKAAHSQSKSLLCFHRLLGTPSLQDFPGMDQLPEYSPDMPPYPPPKGGLASLVKRLPKDGIDLLEKMLRYDPQKRISAAEALEHPFFNDMPRRS